jgi:hypothetical protein
MAAEKRKPRSYKIADTPYKKALRKQKNPPLATFIEQMVTDIADGKDVMSILSPRQLTKPKK